LFYDKSGDLEMDKHHLRTAKWMVIRSKSDQQKRWCFFFIDTCSRDC